MSPSKSQIFCSTSGMQLARYAKELTGMQMGRFPITYLGLPLFKGAPKKPHFQSKMETKNQGWQASALSQAGRLIFMLHVLATQAVHSFQAFLIPKQTKQELESHLRLWKDSKSTVAWKPVCKPKITGGLGLRRLYDFHLACRRWKIWKMLVDKTPWAEFMRERYSNMAGHDGTRAF